MLFRLIGLLFLAFMTGGHARAADGGSIYDYLDTHYPSPYQRAEKESVTAKDLPKNAAIDSIPAKPGQEPNQAQPAAAPAKPSETTAPAVTALPPEPAKETAPRPLKAQPELTAPSAADAKPWKVLKAPEHAGPATPPDPKPQLQVQPAPLPNPAVAAPSPAPQINEPAPQTPPPLAKIAPPAPQPAPVKEIPPAPALATAHSGAVVRSQFTSNITRLEPVDALKEVPASTGNIRYFSEVQGLGGQTLTHRWLKGGKTLLEKRMNIGSDSWRVWSSMRLKPEYAGVVSVLTVDQAGNVLHEDQLVVK